MVRTSFFAWRTIVQGSCVNDSASIGPMLTEMDRFRPFSSASLTSTKQIEFRKPMIEPL